MKKTQAAEVERRAGAVRHTLVTDASENAAVPRVGHARRTEAGDAEAVQTSAPPELAPSPPIKGKE